MTAPTRLSGLGDFTHFKGLTGVIIHTADQDQCDRVALAFVSSIMSALTCIPVSPRLE